MHELGVSQRMLAEVLGCTRGAVGHYLAGRRNPSLEQLDTIAGLLGMDPKWMVFGETPEAQGVGESVPPYAAWPGGSRRVPIYGTTASGAGEKPFGHLDLSSCTDAYALQVVGAAWAPRIQEGELLLLCPEREPVPGDEVWVSYLDGTVELQRLVRFRRDEVILEGLTTHRQRQIRRRQEIASMHPLLAIFRESAGAPSA